MRSTTLSLLSLLAVGALAACSGDASTDKKPDTGGTDTEDSTPDYVDADGDGVTPGDGDCDDDDATLYPGRAEDCDGIDNNCNGVVDEGLPDTDGDGTADCLDTEACDGVDNNGDGTIDEGFEDGDGDGVADCVGSEACDGIDNDADGEVDEGFDADNDGYTVCGSDTMEADCDDTDPAVNPAAEEVDGDSVDNDCDGMIDGSAWAYGDLSITEILSNPARIGDPKGEWFEVRNMTDRTLILNGLVLMDSTGEWHQVASSRIVSIDAGEFFVFGSNSNSATNGSAPVDYQYSGMILGNDSDDIWIYANDVMIDMVAWDDGATMPDPDGASMGLDQTTFGADLNDDPSAWCVAIYSWTGMTLDDKGSPGQVNEYCSSFDHDGDGFSGDDGDCDDGDLTVYPGAWEGTDPADNDCDGYAETAPVAVVSTTGDLETCSDIGLSSAGSYDIEGATLTYSWTLTGAPAGSSKTTSDLESSTSANPSFRPDVAGDYVFTLVVNDGGANSMPESITVTVAERPGNETPVADAGDDSSYSGSADCTPISYGVSYDCDTCTTTAFTLDGTGSSDGNGDELTYSWSIISGSTYGTMTNSTTSSPTVTITGAPATYGSANNTEVEVQLTVSDCMGAESSDTVVLTYACTGT